MLQYVAGICCHRLCLLVFANLCHFLNTRTGVTRLGLPPDWYLFSNVAAFVSVVGRLVTRLVALPFLCCCWCVYLGRGQTSKGSVDRANFNASPVLKLAIQLTSFVSFSFFLIAQLPYIRRQFIFFLFAG